MTRDPALEIDRQRKLVAHANKLLGAGKIRLHQEALVDAIEHVLGDYPLRFSLILRSPNQSQAEAFTQAGQADGYAPDLKITEAGELSWSGGVLGNFAKQDTEDIAKLSDFLPFYILSVIEMRYSDDDRQRLLYLGIEFRRPEMYLNEQGKFVAQPPRGQAELVEVPSILLARALEAEARRKEGGSEGRIARGSAR